MPKWSEFWNVINLIFLTTKSTKIVDESRECFKKNSSLHVSSRNYTFFSFFVPNNFLFIHENFWWPFLVINHKLCYLSIVNLQMTFISRFTSLFLLLRTSFSFIHIHHYKIRLPLLHTFVNHCTFWASLKQTLDERSCYWLEARFMKQNNITHFAVALDHLIVFFTISVLNNNHFSIVRGLWSNGGPACIMYSCMYIVHVCMYVCMHAWMYISVYVCNYVCIIFDFDVCISISMYA